MTPLHADAPIGPAALPACIGDRPGTWKEAACAATPAAPNYTALAEKTSASQNPNQTTPWGNLLRTQNADGSWQQTTTLNPEDQARLDAQRQNQMQATRLQGGLLGQAAQSMGTPFQSQAMDPGFGGVDALKNQYLDYVRPDMERQQSAYASALRQRGIPMNSEAWSNATRAMMDSDARRMWEATDKATSAYNDIFNRGLAADTAGVCPGTRCLRPAF